MMLPALVSAEEKTTYNGKVKITPYELAQRGDSLYVGMQMSMEGTSVERRKALDIIPILTNGTQSQILPKVSIKGQRKYKEYKRQQALMNKQNKAAYIQPYAVEKGFNNNNVIEYKQVLPYQSWMANAYLDAKSDLCGCGDGVRQVAIERLVDNVATEKKIVVIPPYNVTPYLAYVSAEVEEIKRREMSGEAFLDFVVNKTDIRPEFGNNPAELSKIRSLIESVKDDKNVTVRNIDITGYASPEGSVELNKRLSEGRAKSLQSYLQARYDFPNNMYTMHFGGEDWEGLTKWVESSDMAAKSQVLDIISQYSIEKGREKKIMDLAGGEPYKYMLKNAFPSLRRVVCLVDYNVKNFDVNEAKEVIKTHPQNLSLNEMYTVANTYEKGSQEFNDVFETAVKMFPKDPTANLNAAVAALARNDLASAERYLSKIKVKVRIPEYDNAMGVLELLKGNLDKAEQSLEAAKQAGLREAQQNLEELARKRENLEQIAQQTK